MHLYAVILTRRGTSCANARNRFWWGPSTWKRKSRLDSARRPGTTMNFSATCETHLTVVCMPTAKWALLTNVHYTARVSVRVEIRMYRCRAADTFCNQTLLHRSIYTTNRKSRSPLSSIEPRYVQGVSLPVCLPTWMTRYLRRENAGLRRMVVRARCSRLVP